tara:strand:- start:932 stop:1558 length:627 start_codon:yes stop_codon:yes gene_type:complete
MSRKQDYDWDQISEWRTSLKLSYRNLRKKCLEEWGRTPSLSSISYHYGKTTKKKAQARQKRYTEGLRGRLSLKLRDFKAKKIKNYVWEGNKNSNNPKESIRVKVKKYKGKKMTKEIASNIDTSYGIQDVITFLTAKHGLDVENKTAVSALTGEIVDLTKEYHLDHWDNSAGNALENMCILTREENEMKGDLSMGQLLDLCRKILGRHS